MMESRTERDTAPLASDIPHRSDDISVDPGEVKNASRFLKVVTFWNIFDISSEASTPTYRRWIFGFALTFVYLIGVLVIIRFYYDTNYRGGRPYRLEDKSMSYTDIQKKINNKSFDYSCGCQYPPEVKALGDNVTIAARDETFNRCYEPDELKDVDVLQYRAEEKIWERLSQITEKKPQSKEFSDGIQLDWISLHLVSADSSQETQVQEPQLMNLRKRLSEHGYVGTEGSISVTDLANADFFTVPQGFIRAEVKYECKECDKCNDIWKEFGDFQAFAPANGVRDSETPDNSTDDEGWIFCAQDKESDSTQCSGHCRFFKTKHKPWGIAMQNFSKVRLEDNISNPNTTRVVFFPTLLYANWSSFSENSAIYRLWSLEVDRKGPVWAELLDHYDHIPGCQSGSHKIRICAGTSICQFAPVYSTSSVNSEKLNVACMSYPGDNPPKCSGVVDKLGLKLGIELVDWPLKDILCYPRDCQDVDSTQILWNYFDGEIALNRLIYETAIKSAYVPRVCTNNYTQVHLKYKDPKEKRELEGIYEMKCIEGIAKSKGCWLTGNYRKLTAKGGEDWESDEELKGGPPNFACWRLGKQSKLSWVTTAVGTVSGTIGSWLLLLSCFHWFWTRPQIRRTKLGEAIVECAPVVKPQPSSDTLENHNSLDSLQRNSSSAWIANFEIDRDESSLR